MPLYLVVERKTQAVRGVAQADDALSACVEVSRQLGNDRAVLYEVGSNSARGDWLAFELPEKFNDPIAWEMFGADAVKHGTLAAAVARRSTR